MHIVNTGIYRQNLHYQVLHVTNAEEKLSKLNNLIQQSEGSGIIYAATVKAVEELVVALQAGGHSGAAGSWWRPMHSVWASTSPISAS
jgi:ATP-dependent DNA helicase RecQ